MQIICRHCGMPMSNVKYCTCPKATNEFFEMQKLIGDMYSPLPAVKAPTLEEQVAFEKAWDKLGLEVKKQTLSDMRPMVKKEFDEPTHYHQHEIDTITFLQKGFPPDVFMGFAIGHIIKYAHRANYKNGREDFVKMVDYAKRALDWYDKTHS